MLFRLLFSFAAFVEADISITHPEMKERYKHPVFYDCFSCCLFDVQM